MKKKTLFNLDNLLLGPIHMALEVGSIISFISGGNKVITLEPITSIAKNNDIYILNNKYLVKEHFHYFI